MARRFRVGLTGGIASGKSTVANLFAALGVPIIDTDLIAREVVAPGSPLLPKIAEHFGRDVLAADGSLDRRTLRQRVFVDAAERQWLERLTHPEIRRLTEDKDFDIRPMREILGIQPRPLAEGLRLTFS